MLAGSGSIGLSLIIWAGCGIISLFGKGDNFRYPRLDMSSLLLSHMGICGQCLVILCLHTNEYEDTLKLNVFFGSGFTVWH